MRLHRLPHPDQDEPTEPDPFALTLSSHGHSEACIRRIVLAGHHCTCGLVKPQAVESTPEQPRSQQTAPWTLEDVFLPFLAFLILAVAAALVHG